MGKIALRFLVGGAGAGGLFTRGLGEYTELVHILTKITTFVFAE